MIEEQERRSEDGGAPSPRKGLHLDVRRQVRVARRDDRRPQRRVAHAEDDARAADATGCVDETSGTTRSGAAPCCVGETRTSRRSFAARCL